MRSGTVRKAMSIYRKFFTLSAEFRLTKAAIPINQYLFIKDIMKAIKSD
jgi:hypothetical protein